MNLTTYLYRFTALACLTQKYLKLTLCMNKSSIGASVWAQKITYYSAVYILSLFFTAYHTYAGAKDSRDLLASGVHQTYSEFFQDIETSTSIISRQLAADGSLVFNYQHRSSRIRARVHAHQLTGIGMFELTCVVYNADIPSVVRLALRHRFHGSQRADRDQRAQTLIIEVQRVLDAVIASNHAVTTSDAILAMLDGGSFDPLARDDEQQADREPEGSGAPTLPPTGELGDLPDPGNPYALPAIASSGDTTDGGGWMAFDDPCAGIDTGGMAAGGVDGNCFSGSACDPETQNIVSIKTVSRKQFNAMVDNGEIDKLDKLGKSDEIDVDIDLIPDGDDNPDNDKIKIVIYSENDDVAEGENENESTTPSNVNAGNIALADCPPSAPAIDGVSVTGKTLVYISPVDALVFNNWLEHKTNSGDPSPIEDEPPLPSGTEPSITPIDPDCPVGLDTCGQGSDTLPTLPTYVLNPLIPLIYPNPISDGDDGSTGGGPPAPNMLINSFFDDANHITNAREAGTLVNLLRD